jgi:glycine hydroxymethyltransferase
MDAFIHLPIPPPWQVVRNASALADALVSKGYSLVSGGTDNHLVLVDVKKSHGIDGARVEKVLELASIATNKNTVPGDKSALVPGGVRLGTPALTTRGMDEQNMATVADMFDRGVKAAMEVRDIVSPTSKKVKDFRSHLDQDKEQYTSINSLRQDVEEFAHTFPVIGFTEESMRYSDTYKAPESN